MNDDERWERYFFADHTRAELAEWVQRLSFFRFCRAHGGHAGDRGEPARIAPIDRQRPQDRRIGGQQHAHAIGHALKGQDETVQLQRNPAEKAGGTLHHGLVCHVFTRWNNILLASAMPRKPPTHNFT